MEDTLQSHRNCDSQNIKIHGNFLRSLLFDRHSTIWVLFSKTYGTRSEIQRNFIQSHYHWSLRFNVPFKCSLVLIHVLISAMKESHTFSTIYRHNMYTHFSEYCDWSTLKPFTWSGQSKNYTIRFVGLFYEMLPSTPFHCRYQLFMLVQYDFGMSDWTLYC